MELLPLMGTTLLMFLLEEVQMINYQGVVFWSFFIFTVVSAYLFLSTTIDQLSTYLKIYCFTLKKRPGHPLYVAEGEKNK